MESELFGLYSAIAEAKHKGAERVKRLNLG
jgi:hypothetical protein